MVAALHQTARRLDVHIRTPSPLTRIQQRRITLAVGSLAPAIRWHAATTLRVSLPLTISDDAALAPCVPILRQGGTTVWWPLASTPHILLAADAHHTLAAMIGALARTAVRCPLMFALFDPTSEVRTLALPGLTAAADAIAMARMRALRVAWTAQRGEVVEQELPLILVVAAPDEIVWRDLMPLLATPTAGISVLVLLNTSVGLAEARDLCHSLPVLEIGGGGAALLPESHRPPGAIAPHAGEALAWRPGLGVTRGTPLCTTDAALAEWHPPDS